MIVDDLFGIVHAVFRLKIVVFREVLVCKGKESVSDVGADGFAEWGGGGVVPEYVRQDQFLCAAH